MVIKHLADGLSPVEWESLEVLVTDGGTISPKEIAEVTDRHPDSVRRALDRISELVDHQYGSVSLRSNFVAELVYEAVKKAKEWTQKAVEAGAKALDAAERGLDENTSAFIAWAATHDIKLNERDDPIRLELGELDAENHDREVRRILREGQRLWENVKRDPAVFRAGRYRYQIQEPEHDLRSVEASTVTRTIGGRVWEALR